MLFYICGIPFLLKNVVGRGVNKWLPVKYHSLQEGVGALYPLADLFVIPLTPKLCFYDDYKGFMTVFMIESEYR